MPDPAPGRDEDPRERDRLLRERVLALLDGGTAHLRARDVLAKFPVRRAGEILPGLAHSAWQLLEHLRIAQRDILDFAEDRDYRELAWPADYWPKAPAPPTATAFRGSASAFLADLKRCQRLVRDRSIDLLAELPNGSGALWLQQVFLVASHNAYHLGQLLQVRRALEASEDPDPEPRGKR